MESINYRLVKTAAGQFPLPKKYPRVLITSHCCCLLLTESIPRFIHTCGVILRITSWLKFAGMGGWRTANLFSHREHGHKCQDEISLQIVIRWRWWPKTRANKQIDSRKKNCLCRPFDPHISYSCIHALERRIEWLVGRVVCYSIASKATPVDDSKQSVEFHALALVFAGALRVEK